jgi:hypothetical protein
MLSVSGELRELQLALAADGTPMTPNRILNALIWTVKSGNEAWILKQPSNIHDASDSRFHVPSLRRMP